MLTTLTEMNLLYAVYAAATDRNDAPAAHLAWRAYVQYVHHYNNERGMAVVMDLPE